MKAVVFALLLALVACGGKKDPGSETGSGATGSAAAASGSATGSAATGSAAGSAEVAASAPEAALPTEVDFEDDAAARITEKNVDAELQAIENQLAP
jgi:hypothetical protein